MHHRGIRIGYDELLSQELFSMVRKILLDMDVRGDYKGDVTGEFAGDSQRNWRKA